MGWTRCIRCEKFRHDFVARTFSLIAPVQPKLLRVLYSNKMILNALKPYETHQNMSLGPMGWTRCVRCKNVRCDFVGRTFASIATVRPVLHRVWCSNEMITNAAKHYETHKTMSLGSNGLDRVRSFLKIPSQLHGTNFCTNCTSSAQFAPCFVW